MTRDGTQRPAVTTQSPRCRFKGDAVRTKELVWRPRSWSRGCLTTFLVFARICRTAVTYGGAPTKKVVSRALVLLIRGCRTMHLLGIAPPALPRFEPCQDGGLARA